MSLSFLLQTIKIFHNGNYNENDLEKVYNFLSGLEKDVLISYFSRCSVISYNNDLEFYLEILEKCLKILEDKEEYEKCAVLKKQKDLSIDIMTIKNFKNDAIWIN